MMVLGFRGQEKYIYTDGAQITTVSYYLGPINGPR
jgi:hypothetical protein